MGTIVVWLIIFLNFILQGTLFQHFAIFGVVPNTSLVIIVCFSLFANKNKGAVFGFVAGALQDILYGQSLGVYTLIYMLIGYFIGLINRKIFRDNLIISFFVTAVATLFYIIINISIIYMLGFEITTLPFSSITIQVLYNSIISIFLYLYVYKLYRKRILKF